MTKVWVLKLVASAHCDSTRVKSWLAQYNVWVPGVIRERSTSKRGYVHVRFAMKPQAIDLLLPKVGIRVELARPITSVSLPLLKEIRALADNGSYNIGAYETMHWLV